MKSLLFSLSLLFILTSCSPKITPPTEPATTFYQEQMKKWQVDRRVELTSPDSWLALTGLFWLKEGENSFGSSVLNTIIFPEGSPNYIGTFLVENGEVTMKIAENVSVVIGEDASKEVNLKPDISGDPTKMQLGSLTWYLIKREDRLAIRLIDAENPALKKLDKLEYFPSDENWVIPAQLKPVENGKTITLRNVIDMDVTMKLEGYLQFEINGEPYELEAMDGGPDLYFIIFADETTGVETYGAGRYMYIPRVDDRGKTLLDFNKAYNPPCAFTDFATCPLPSDKNRLSIAITAGEKNYKKPEK